MSKRNNPFESHIESNEFDINPLIDAGTNIPHHVLHPRLEEWLESMPHPMTREQWDDQLDNMQKRLRHSLATEIVQRGMLDEFSQQLDNIDDETLILLMHYPITVALLSQDYFRRNGYPHNWETLESNDTDTPDNTDLSVLQIWQKWGGVVIQRIKTWVGQLLKRLVIRQ